MVTNVNLCADFLRMFTTIKAQRTVSTYAAKHAIEEMFAPACGHYMGTGSVVLAALLIGAPLCRPEAGEDLYISKPEWTFVRRRTREGQWFGWEREKEPPGWAALADKFRRPSMPLPTGQYEAGQWCDPHDEYVRRIKKP